MSVVCRAVSIKVWVNQLYYNLEKLLFNRASWTIHTHTLLKRDNGSVILHKCYVIATFSSDCCIRFTHSPTLSRVPPAYPSTFLSNHSRFCYISGISNSMPTTHKTFYNPEQTTSKLCDNSSIVLIDFNYFIAILYSVYSINKHKCDTCVQHNPWLVQHTHTHTYSMVAFHCHLLSQH